MIPKAIIWDFDGTLYPLQPYDSEQTLLLLRLSMLKMSDGIFRRRFTQLMIHADQQQWFKNRILRKIYSRMYGWCLNGTPTSLLDKTAEKIAATIGKRDRQVLLNIKKAGCPMHIISCGTLNLVERILMYAGLRNCFATVQANPLTITDGVVSGLKSSLITAQEKLFAAKRLYHGNRCGLMAVGDGYTDIPLLDWVELPVMITRDNLRKNPYAAKPYHFIPTVAALEKVLLTITK